MDVDFNNLGSIYIMYTISVLNNMSTQKKKTFFSRLKKSLPNAGPFKAATLSSFVPKLKSSYVSTWANETVVPPPEHKDMRFRAESSKLDLDSLGNQHSNNEAPWYSDYAQQDESDSGNSTNTGTLTMKDFGLPEVLTAPDTITIYEACCLMSAGGADAIVLTDSNALVSGILTNKDIVSRVIASGIDSGNTHVSNVMTKNPIFVSSDTHPMEALLKMMQGEVTHLPIIENSEVIGIVRLMKCVLDAVKSKPMPTTEEGELLATAIQQVMQKLARWDIKLDTDS